MTRFEQLCDIIAEATSDIDENLVAALIIAIAEKRHLVFTTRNSRHACQYLEALGKLIFGYQDPVTINCNQETTWNDIVNRVTQSHINAHTVGPIALGPVWNRENQTDNVIQVATENQTSDLIILHGFDRTSSYVKSMLLNALTANYVKRGTVFPANIMLVIVIDSPPQVLGPHLCEKMFLHQYLDSKSIGDVTILETLIRQEASSSSGATTSSSAATEAENNDTKSQLSWLQFEVQTYINDMRCAMDKVTIVDDVYGYMQDLCVFVRTHRLVSRGLSPRAVQDFERLVRAICILHDYRFATPSLVAVCARKIFPLKIQVCKPYDEPSLNYGGDIDLVEPWMAKWDEALIVEDVLSNVAPPV